MKKTRATDLACKSTQQRWNICDKVFHFNVIMEKYLHLEYWILMKLGDKLKMNKIDLHNSREMKPEKMWGSNANANPTKLLLSRIFAYFLSLIIFPATILFGIVVATKLARV